MNDVIALITQFGTFFRETFIDIIPLGGFLIGSLCIGSVIDLAMHRRKNGK